MQQWSESEDLIENGSFPVVAIKVLLNAATNEKA
jgi:hypothetical protein